MKISYVSPKIEGRETQEKGRGLFARVTIPEDELLLIWGGNIIDIKDYQLLTDDQKAQSVMLEEEVYLVNMEEDLAAWINHSCDPNAWLLGQINVYSRREIPAGEEICFDYGTCVGVSDPIEEFACKCGSPNCRGQVTADDWRNPELQARYAGHFMAYLERRIERLKAAQP
jgi:SET domain-containing protein